jgi:hypothetical protein
MDPSVATLLRTLIRDGSLPAARFSPITVHAAIAARYVIRFVDSEHLAVTPAGRKALSDARLPEPLWRRALRVRGQVFR